MVEYKNIILKDTERALPYKSKSGGDNRKNHPCNSRLNGMPFPIETECCFLV